MATIYGARDRRLLRDVAVKVLEPNLVSDRGQRLFNREARAIAALRHNNIVQVYDYAGPEESPPYIVMELVDGFNLDQVMERGHPLPEPVIQVVLARVASALAHAHARGVVHRDLKPSNVLLERAGRVLLADFGIAKAYDNPTRLGETAAGTHTGVMGTPEFMSPEQLAERPVGPPSDVFSLGSLTYCMAVGRSPFEAGTDVVEVLRRIMDVEFRDLLEIRPELSRDLVLQIDACLQRHPETRPPAAEVAQLCNTWLYRHEIHEPEQLIAELLEDAGTTVVTELLLNSDVILEVRSPDDGRDNPEPVRGAPAPIERDDTDPDERGETEIAQTPVAAAPKAKPPRPELVSGHALSAPTAVGPAPDSVDVTELARVRGRWRPPPSPPPRPPRSVAVPVLITLAVLIAGGSIATFVVVEWRRSFQGPVPQTPSASRVATVGAETSEAEAESATEVLKADEEAEHVEPAEEPDTHTERRRRGRRRGHTKAKAWVEEVQTGEGVVEVVVKPWGTVFIDGVKQGKTPVFRRATVPAGRHTVTVRHPILGEIVKTVVIEDGDHDILRIDLNP